MYKNRGTRNYITKNIISGSINLNLDDPRRSGPDRAPGLVRRVQLEHLRQRQDGRQLYRRDREGGHEAARRAAG